ncbi:hypothetical protein CCO03_14520 [Comamonas serinivorans]|uniref:Surface layer protein NpdA n=1 Tax=Comamonas serinivorans TaxID=1082851 RepID=A0A1Y0EQ00_9BURK|nr:hypothetical protein [Comamonas serinivorans]ARU05737.1 hypothetical protein CCO03_14520 [Comamonas serinivorans]
MKQTKLPRWRAATLAAAGAVTLACAGAAQAQLFGPGTGTTATQLRWTSDEPGHQLITPYFSTQGDNNTLLSWVNTDRTNGKLLKVRFRGAANGDTLLDFTVLLGPGDVWTASLSQGEDGITRLTSPDGSCTLPASLKDVAFRTDRLQPGLTATAQAMHTREGLVETVQMADVAPGSLYDEVRRKRCAADVLAPLTQPGALATEAQAQALGLAQPTGGLMGMWQIIRLSNYASYAGRQHAIAAVDALGQRAAANWAWAPQSAEPADDVAKAQTTDPVLTLHGLTWGDLPDLSTPVVGTSAQGQVQALAAGITATAVANEFVSTAEGASVPGSTDWVLTQPLKRYVMAFDGQTGQVVPADRAASWQVVTKPWGKQVCTSFTPLMVDRDGVSHSTSFSVVSQVSLCGVVDVPSMPADDGSETVLQTAFTPRGVWNIIPQALQAGWVRASFAEPEGLPVLGYAATSLRNVSQNGNYGSVTPHVRLLSPAKENP